MGSRVPAAHYPGNHTLPHFREIPPESAQRVRAARRGVWAEIRAEGVRIVRVNGSYTLAGARGSTISLLPLGTARGVSIRGCYYLIDDYTLESDSSRGMSNVVTADEAVITVREGDLLLFHYSDIHGHGESA